MKNVAKDIVFEILTAEIQGKVEEWTQWYKRSEGWRSVERDMGTVPVKSNRWCKSIKKGRSRVSGEVEWLHAEDVMFYRRWFLFLGEKLEDWREKLEDWRECIICISYSVFVIFLTIVFLFLFFQIYFLSR